MKMRANQQQVEQVPSTASVWTVVTTTFPPINSSSMNRLCPHATYATTHHKWICRNIADSLEPCMLHFSRCQNYCTTRCHKIICLWAVKNYIQRLNNANSIKCTTCHKAYWRQPIDRALVSNLYYVIWLYLHVSGQLCTKYHFADRAFDNITSWALKPFQSDIFNGFAHNSWQC